MPGNCWCSTNPMFQPAMRQVIAITNARQPLVTTYVDHLYAPGTKIRFDIPQCDGMREINGLVASILSTPSPTTFTIDIDTTTFDRFAILVQPSMIQANLNPLVTLPSPVTYIAGMNVRFNIPLANGMQELNNQIVAILAIISPLSFTLNADTSLFTPFVYVMPANDKIVECAMVVPIGEENAQLNAALHNIYG